MHRRLSSANHYSMRWSFTCAHAHPPSDSHCLSFTAEPISVQCVGYVFFLLRVSSCVLLSCGRAYELTATCARLAAGRSPSSNERRPPFSCAQVFKFKLSATGTFSSMTYCQRNDVCIREDSPNKCVRRKNEQQKTALGNIYTFVYVYPRKMCALTCAPASLDALSCSYALVGTSQINCERNAYDYDYNWHAHGSCTWLVNIRAGANDASMIDMCT